MNRYTSVCPAPADVICIIGMHRSGTSMVARLLSLCGLYLGSEDQLFGPNEGNPDGHFEHTGFLEIDEELLHHFGGAWESPPRLDPGWQNDPTLSRLATRARALIESFPTDVTWGWKDPRTTILLEFWKSLVPNLRFVICVRNPMDIAKSLARRNGMTIDACVQLWYRYMRDALRGTAGYPVAFTSYDDYFVDAAAEIRRLTEFCRLPEPQDCTRFRNIVSDGLRHHVSADQELLTHTGVGTETKMLHLFLRSLLNRELNGADRDLLIYRYANEFLGLTDLLRSQGRVMQLEGALNQKVLELSNAELRIQSTNQKISQIEKQLSDLQQRAERLQSFSDAVRQTFVYRLYRILIKPLTEISSKI